MPIKYIVLLCLMIDLLGCEALTSQSIVTTSSGRPFPLIASANNRYLQDKDGIPFPILGRTAWFITSLSEPDYKEFIDETVLKGYNAIEFHVINHDPRGNHPPFGFGDHTLALPFTAQLNGSAWAGALSYTEINAEAPDFTMPNGVYWSQVDKLLAYCESKGILVFMFPAYVGYTGSEQGWIKEMVANGPIKMQAYGTWIATRYQHRKNLIWMVGGDMMAFDTRQTAVEYAFISGLKSVPNQQSTHYSAEWKRGSIATDQPDFGSQMTLNGAYVGSLDVNIQCRKAYAHSPTIPAFLLEEPYEEGGPHITQPERRFQWWGWLSCIGGYVSGNHFVWPFNPGWKSHLQTNGTQDMARLNAFVRSIAWYDLVPSDLDGMRTLVTAGASSPGSSDYVAAAATSNGTLLVAYVPPDHSGPITLDMTVMSGSARARWFNPASGLYLSIGTFVNNGPSTFTPPGNNGTGFTDWVLLLEKQ